MVRLENGTPVGPYRIQRFIKDGVFNSNYVAADASGKHVFLKVFDRAAVPASCCVDGEVAEIVNCRQVDGRYFNSYVADGTVNLQGRDCPWLAMQFFKGALLSEYLDEGRSFKDEEIRMIISCVVKGLLNLHGQFGLNHNDITPRNILLEETPEGLVPKLIDLGHAHADLNGGEPPFPLHDLNLLYTAPEALDGVFTPASDAFSVSAVAFTLICGQTPWLARLDEDLTLAEQMARLKEFRRREPVWPAALHTCTRNLRQVVFGGLRVDYKRRMPVSRMLELLSTSDPNQPRWSPGPDPAAAESGQKETPDGGLKATTDGTELKKTLQRGSGHGGFADVAGMDDLKEMLLRRVIWVLRDREKARQYRLMPPNGMLLYGPPGCGKTYFAQKFAEESRFNYMLVNGSDLGSTYIHGTQGKIAALFQEAAAKAPTVLCFDEFDSFVPVRGSDGARNRQEEVNEFLSQLNNCAERGIFVIGTTNRVDMIDPAVLRKGRLDLHVEIPAPDHATRRAMFVHHLKGRPLDADIDYDELARLTDGYASSDIAFLANDAALVAALANEKIAQRHLLDSIRCNPSSLARPERRTPIGYK